MADERFPVNTYVPIEMQSGFLKGKVSVEVTKDCIIEVTHSNKNDVDYFNIAGDRYNKSNSTWYHGVHGACRSQITNSAVEAFKAYTKSKK